VPALHGNGRPEARAHQEMIALLIAAALAAADPMLDQVMQRAGAYVMEFERRLSMIVAEETYEQAVEPPTKGGPCKADSTYQSTMNCHAQLKQTARSTSRADFALVRSARGPGYIQHRDVFELDGRAVRHRDERLAALLAEGAPVTETQRQQIFEE